MTAAEQLRRAAETLRARAEAERVAWNALPYDEQAYDAAVEALRQLGFDDAPTAELAADWLEVVAGAAELIDATGGVYTEGSVVGRALALAEHINGRAA